MSFSFKNNFYTFGIISLIYILISYWGQSQLVSSELFYNQFSDQISLKKANQVYELSKNFSVVGYILIPFLYAAKFLIIAAIIQIGIEIEELELSFANCFRIVMQGEIIFILPALIKIIWFGYYETNYNMDRLNDFSPISLYSIFRIRHFVRIPSKRLDKDYII